MDFTGALEHTVKRDDEIYFSFFNTFDLSSLRFAIWAFFCFPEIESIGLEIW